VEANVVWSRRIADELWSGAVTPLTFSLLAEEMAEHMVRRRLANAGLARAGDEPVLRLVRGHVYVNASMVADVMCEVPALFLSEGLLALLPEALRESVRQRRRSLLAPQTLGTILRLTRFESAWLPWLRGAAFRDEAVRVARTLARYSVPADASLPELKREMESVRGQLAQYLEIVSWGMIYAYVFFHLTSHLLARWAPEEADAMSDLTAGLEGIQTFEAHDELVECARLAAADPTLRQAVLGSDPGTIALACARREMGTFGDRVLSLLVHHGHRLVARDLCYPTWRERPAIVIEMVQQLLADGAPFARESRAARRSARSRRLATRIGRGVGGSLKQELFSRCLAWCQEYYAVRENMRYYADAFLAALRALALSAGDRLARAGALEQPDDVFYLTYDEIMRSEETASRGNALARASERRAEYAGYRTSPPPEVLHGDVIETASPTRLRPRPLHGVGASPGLASGLARVIRTVDDLHALRRGEVMVAAATDPSWTSLVGLGKALVLEFGGLLSHGAIVARELGIPAVVDVPSATTLLATGDRLTVDGGAGVVAIV
jgi:phosphohistidine swiveling domain-containing protein